MQTLPLFEQLCCNGVTLPETLEQLRPCQLEMEQVRIGGRMQVGSLKKGKEKGKSKHQNQKGTRSSNTGNTSNTSNRWVKDCRRPGGWSIRQQQQQQQHKQRQAQTRKAKADVVETNLSLPKQPQPCRIFHRHRARSELSRAIQARNRKVGTQE